MKQLIINGDDLGVCEATNLAIAEAFTNGILTSASLMANGPAFEFGCWIPEYWHGCHPSRGQTCCPAWRMRNARSLKR